MLEAALSLFEADWTEGIVETPTRELNSRTLYCELNAIDKLGFPVGGDSGNATFLLTF
ncbi:hypothetical protein Tcan_09040 [Toxocara canis]|uniref:Uncharacterized protein n=1 Tax=Toxocara canis TaxID=6265 RepID=A0A0B2VDA1_TOXCA|nr:hypothetical protein Tcan_09040 [Toxocara canis]